MRRPYKKNQKYINNIYMEKNNREDLNSSFSLVVFLLKHWKIITIVCVATAVLSFIFSTPLFIKPKYQSTAIIYAPRTNSVAKILLNQENYNERLEVKFGSVDYKLNSEMSYSIEGDGIILFDKESSKNIGKGALKLN